MLFGIYLGTTIYVWRSMLKFVKVFKERLEKDGYEMIRVKNSPLEILLYSGLLCAPVLNLFFSYFFVNTDKRYEEIKNIFIKKGALRKIESNLDEEVDEEEIEAEEVYNDPDMFAIDFESKKKKTDKKDEYIYITMGDDGNLKRIYVDSSSENQRLFNNLEELKNYDAILVPKGKKAQDHTVITSKDVEKMGKKLKKITKEIERQTIVDDRPLYPLMDQHYIQEDNGYAFKKSMKR